MKNNALWTKTAILIAGILVGFLIGRISIKEEVTIPAQDNAPVSASVQKSEENQPAQQANPVIIPKALDKISGVSAEDDDVLGNPSAPITIVEFTDYQCTFCKKYYSDNFELIKKDYVETGKVKYVVRDFPLDEHPQAMLAAGAAECAGEQGKYWEMHDRLFIGQEEWSYQNGALGTFKSYAASLKLDTATFDKCLDTGKYDTEIAKDIVDGETYTVKSTPTIFIDDKKIVGAQSFELFKNTIDAELARKTAETRQTKP